MSLRLYPSPLGAISIAASRGEITGLWFEDEPYDAAKAALMPCEPVDETVLTMAALWLDEYFKGHSPQADFPLNPRGTAFQKSVWRELSKIPYGETRTYSQIAQILGSAAIAVGSAVGQNPILLILPCHRVVSIAKNGSGYAGGMERKKALLALEQR